MKKNMAQKIVFSALAVAMTLCAKEIAIREKSSPHLLAVYLSPTVADPIAPGSRSLHDLTETEKVIKAILKTNLRRVPHGGVFTTYLGFVDILSIDDFALFPLKHAGDEVTVVIVKRMYPIILQGQTVERFIRKKAEPASFYQMKRIKDEKTTDTYWETKKLETPRDLTIPPHAVVICAKPEEIFIPEGLTTALPGPHLYLPEIFPTSHFKRGMYADVMTFIKISPYFESVRPARRIQKDRFAEMIEST